MSNTPNSDTPDSSIYQRHDIHPQNGRKRSSILLPLQVPVNAPLPFNWQSPDADFSSIDEAWPNSHGPWNGFPADYAPSMAQQRVPPHMQVSPLTPQDRATETHWHGHAVSPAICGPSEGTEWTQAGVAGRHDSMIVGPMYGGTQYGEYTQSDTRRGSDFLQTRSNVTMPELVYDANARCDQVLAAARMQRQHEGIGNTRMPGLSTLGGSSSNYDLEQMELMTNISPTRMTVNEEAQQLAPYQHVAPADQHVASDHYDSPRNEHRTNESEDEPEPSPSDSPTAEVPLLVLSNLPDSFRLVVASRRASIMTDATFIPGFKCSVPKCVAGLFSSNACLLRHEREAHGQHGHGYRPFLCDYPPCERSRPGHGFSRMYNVTDHMRRVHKHVVTKRAMNGVETAKKSSQEESKKRKTKQSKRREQSPAESITEDEAQRTDPATEQVTEQDCADDAPTTPE